MKKVLFLTTLFVVLFLIPFNVFASVVINEIAWMGIVGNQYGEWIELYNSGGEEIDLNNWKLYKYKDGNNILIFTLTKKLSSKSYLVIERTTDSSPDPLPNISDESGKFGGGGLLNLPGGEHLILKDSEDNNIEDLDFSNGWPEGNNTTKQTMERIVSGWQTSLNPGGTPKAPNSSGAIEEPGEAVTERPEAPPIPTGNNPPIADAGDNIIGFINQEIKFDGSQSSDPDGDELSYSWNTGDGNSLDKIGFAYKYAYPGTYLATLTVYDGRFYTTDTITIKIQSQQITINEFLPNPSGKDEEEEWIEIYNDSDSIVDISSWQLDDEASGSQPFVFPKNTLIAPKTYLVFSRQITKIALNNDKDSVRLLLPEGVVFQEITYEKPPLGKSSARTSEGFVWSVPTPGAPNISGIAMLENKNITYQYQIKPETTKESTQDYSILYQNEKKAKIEGGYTTTSINKEQSSFAPTKVGATESKLAAVKGDFLKQSQTNLIFIILAIIAGGLIIGLILTKFLKKSP